MTTVLVVDDELGFLLWLGAVLDQAGYRPVPAKTVIDAARTARKFPPDLLIINLGLRGAGSFVETLRRHNPGLKVIALGPRNQADDVTFADRPAEIDEKTAGVWLALIANAVGGPKGAKRRHGGGSLSE